MSRFPLRHLYVTVLFFTHRVLTNPLCSSAGRIRKGPAPVSFALAVMCYSSVLTSLVPSLIWRFLSMSSTRRRANLLLDERRTTLDIPMWMRFERDEPHLQDPVYSRLNRERDRLTLNQIVHSLHGFRFITHRLQRRIHHRRY